MENKIMIISMGIMILLLVLVIAFSLGNNDSKINAAATSFNEVNSAYKGVLTGTTDDGNVAIELKPHNPIDSEFSVDISVNTHSVDLSQYDLTQITTLEYKGKTIKPISAPSLGGHHVSGILVFPIEENPEEFTIKINGIPSVDERVFEWR